MEHSGKELEGLVDQAIAVADPTPGADGWPVRLLLATSLYGAFDRLRCQEAPFDRAAYAEHLGRLKNFVRAFEAAGPSSSPRPTSELDIEEKVADLYGRYWANYTAQSFLETVRPFHERFGAKDT